MCHCYCFPSSIARPQSLRRPLHAPSWYGMPFTITQYTSSGNLVLTIFFFFLLFLQSNLMSTHTSLIITHHTSPTSPSIPDHSISPVATRCEFFLLICKRAPIQSASAFTRRRIVYFFLQCDKQIKMNRRSKQQQKSLTMKTILMPL